VKKRSICLLLNVYFKKGEINYASYNALQQAKQQSKKTRAKRRRCCSND
jgi:hypothetical protein